ncbi:MAG: hypothetical protein AB1916_16715, partial [Thermodesulfobacteriota bacterium]
IQQNAAAAEEMASTSEELSSQAVQLQQTMAFFRLNGHGRKAAPAAATARAGRMLSANRASSPKLAGALAPPQARASAAAGLALDMAAGDGDEEFERF